jgi:hypothetical protein
MKLLKECEICGRQNKTVALRPNDHNEHLCLACLNQERAWQYAFNQRIRDAGEVYGDSDQGMSQAIAEAWMKR